MFLRREVGKCSSSKPLIQLQHKGSQGSGPDWLPLKQDWNKRWCTLPEEYTEELARRIDGFATRDGDVFVVTFMKSGTTWMQELAWLLLNNLDYDRAKITHTMKRCPHIEHSCILSSLDYVSMCDQMPDNPRLIKSHLPSQLLPRQVWQQKRKIIYVARNLKDVVISSFHFGTGLGFWQGHLDDLVDEFITDRVWYTSYWSHVMDFYRMRNEPNVFFVTFEEMIRDLKDVIERLSRFLDVKDLTEMEMERLLKHLSFENMKESKFINPTNMCKKAYPAKDDFVFMRRGIVGSFEDELSPELIKKLDSWTKDSLKEYGLKESDIFGEM